MHSSKRFRGISIPCVPLCSMVLILLVSAAGSSAGQNKAIGKPNPISKPGISALIDKLQETPCDRVDYDGGITGLGFKPVGESRNPGWVPHRTSTLRDIVALGALAIPALISHLNDARPTKIDIDSFMGARLYRDEYDYNPRTNHPKPTGVNRDTDSSVTKHTVTVGDLCFVALGQIVNRNFEPVRSQPTACIMINSPTSSALLRSAIVKEWGGFTPQQHMASLIRDFINPDSGARLQGACIRLGYYYPDALAKLVLKQLSTPTCNFTSIYELIRNQLYVTTDANKRKRKFDAFVAKHGTIAKTGILVALFMDLQEQDADEGGNLYPPLQVKYHARVCLSQLFGYPRAITSKDDPHILGWGEIQVEQFIDALRFVSGTRYVPSIRKILHRTDNRYIANSCVNYLISKGADASIDIQQYVSKRKPSTSGAEPGELNALTDRIGWTPLHLAIERDEAERAESLVLQGANVNAMAANGQTPLHIAAARGDAAAVAALLGWKALPGVKDKAGRTPLQLAATKSYSEAAVKALVAGGATPSTVLEATLADRADLVEVMLSKIPGSVNMRGNGNSTSLHIAARLGYAVVARVLMAHGADIEARDSSQLTALHEAVRYRQPEVVKLLLENNADKNAKSWEGKTALDYARSTANHRAISLLSK